jgi:peptide/nickel transport system permease protein
MTNYILRRLLLLPITLFLIVLVNFVILNLAPGDPVSVTDMSSSGELSRQEGSKGDNQYLLFRQHYGLTLPILFNSWPSLKSEQVKEALHTLSTSENEMKASEIHALKTLWGDRAPFVMPLLLSEAVDTNNSLEIRKLGANLFIRGATRSGLLGSNLNTEEKAENKKIADDNLFLSKQTISSYDKTEEVNRKVENLSRWFEANSERYPYPLSFSDKTKTFFLETRFYKYFSRIATLNFGSLRNDSNKSVVSEVAKRMKYSLTLAILPMLITFALCQFFGMLMAVKQNRPIDYLLNTLFLILFAVPVFVVAPFLIEKVGLGGHVPFTKIAIPISGFHSPEAIYENLTSQKRLFDVSLHLFLPLIAVIYGTLAIQSRLARTAILEVLRQDFVKMAKAKGLATRKILVKHVGRNAAITIVTSLAASFGVVLGGSLIVETVFEINGFGRFFYEAILNRDYNVMLFSVFAGSILSLTGYLAADIAYTVLDPRVSLE